MSERLGQMVQSLKDDGWRERRGGGGNWLTQAILQRNDVVGKQAKIMQMSEGGTELECLVVPILIPGQSSRRGEATLVVAEGGETGFDIDMYLPDNCWGDQLHCFDSMVDFSKLGGDRGGLLIRSNAGRPVENPIFIEASDDPRDKLVLMRFEADWQGRYDPRNFQGLTKEELLSRVLDTMTGSYRAVGEYLVGFNRNEIPKLVRARKERVAKKEPGWVAGELERVAGVTIVNQGWDIPKWGIEPVEFEAAAKCRLSDKDIWGLVVRQDERTFDDGGGSEELEVWALLPEWMQEEYQQIANDRTRVKELKSVDLLMLGTGKYKVAFDLGLLSIGEGRIAAEWLGLHVDIPDIIMEEMKRSGIGHERLIGKMVDAIKRANEDYGRILESKR